MAVNIRTFDENGIRDLIRGALTAQGLNVGEIVLDVVKYAAFQDEPAHRVTARAKVVILPADGYCSHCGLLVGLRGGVVPYHDYPVPCRSVCPGAMKPPVAKGIKLGNGKGIAGAGGPGPTPRQSVEVQNMLDRHGLTDRTRVVPPAVGEPCRVFPREPGEFVPDGDRSIGATKFSAFCAANELPPLTPPDADER